MPLDKDVKQELEKQFAALAKEAGQMLDYPVPTNLTMKLLDPRWLEASPEIIYYALAAYATSAIYAAARPELLIAGNQAIKSIHEPNNLFEDELTFGAALWTITTTLTPLMLMKVTNDKKLQDLLQSPPSHQKESLPQEYFEESYSLFIKFLHKILQQSLILKQQFNIKNSVIHAIS